MPFILRSHAGEYQVESDEWERRPPMLLLETVASRPPHEARLQAIVCKTACADYGSRSVLQNPRCRLRVLSCRMPVPETIPICASGSNG